MIIRFRTATLIVLSACSTQPQSGPPVRLDVGASDTVVVNSRHPTVLAVRALDAEGRAAVGAPIRYAWTGGDSLPVSASGTITCTKSGDVAVQAVSGRLAKRLVVQCRLVEYVRIPGPVQFVLGDPTLSRPFALPLAAYGADGRPISPFAVGRVVVKDTSVAALNGLILYPRARGITGVGAQVGDRDTWIGIHVYQRVSSLASLDTLLRLPDHQRLFAVPIQLHSGEWRRQHLPPGDWMLTMLPETDSASDRVHLRIEGARCHDHFLNSPRRWGCATGPDATVLLYRPSVSLPAREATAYLLVRWLFT